MHVCKLFGEPSVGARGAPMLPVFLIQTESHVAATPNKGILGRRTGARGRRLFPQSRKSKFHGPPSFNCSSYWKVQPLTHKGGRRSKSGPKMLSRTTSMWTPGHGNIGIVPWTQYPH
ncbi:hypothetical protein R1flu_023241 [Riccia fluitans]|uniref:Ribosomal protein L2 n=1 Tax=Riccia fluitans TaxID=41844 RepID=A0ABD1XS05_9MARC